MIIGSRHMGQWWRRANPLKGGIRPLAFIGCLSFIYGCSDEPKTTGAAAEWSLSTRPSVEIGKEGDPRYEFVRIVAISLLSDGGVVVADGGNRLRVFDGSGRFLRVLGRGGDGPGEFRNLIGIGVQGDSVFAIEAFPAVPRFHIFDAARGFLTQIPLNQKELGDRVAPRAIVSASVLAVTRGRGVRVVTPPPDGAITRDSVALGILRLGEPQAVTWLGPFAGNTWFSYPLPPESPVRRGLGRYVLGPSLVLAASDGRLWIGDSGTGEISVFDSSGARILQTHSPIAARRFDDAALGAARDAALSGIRRPDRVGTQARIEMLYSPDLRPTHAPAFTRFAAGPNGEMWIECFSETVMGEHCAVVLDGSGREIGRTVIPAGLMIHAVSHDRVVGVRTDTDGVERIVIHELRR